MAIADLLDRLRCDAGTAGTYAVLSAVPAKPAPVLACTAGTAGTLQGEGTALQLVSGWLLHFPDHDPLPVHFCPAVSHTHALASYPDAVAAEPIPERSRRTATEAESDELRGLIESVYCGETDADRAEALDAALNDTAAALRCYRTITKGEATRRGNHELE